MKIPVSLVRFRVRAPKFKEPASGGFLRSGTNPLSKVRFTRHIPVARPSGRADARCKNAPGIFVRVRAPKFKEPASGGFFAFVTPVPSPLSCFTPSLVYLCHSTVVRQPQVSGMTMKMSELTLNYPLHALMNLSAISMAIPTETRRSCPLSQTGILLIFICPG